MSKATGVELVADPVAELGQQFIQSADHRRCSLCKFRAVEKQHASLDRDLTHDLLHGGDAIVERGLRIRKREAPLLAHHGPVLHLVAAEDHALHVLDVQDEQTLRSEQQVIDLYLAAIRIGDDEPFDTGVSDLPEYALQVVATGTAPVDEPRRKQQQQDRQQPGRICRIKEVCHLAEPAPSQLAY